MNRFWTAFLLTVASVSAWQPHASGQTRSSADKARIITIDQLRDLDRFDGQLVEIVVLARHVGSQRLFTFGKEEGREVPVLLLNPSVDTANLGDALTVTGTVRRFDPGSFARDYSSFKARDFQDIAPGTLVIVASSLRSAEGGQLSPAAPQDAQKRTLTPMPKTVTLGQLNNIGTLEGQLVQLNAPVAHTDSGQVFTIGEKQGPQVHIVVPRPAIDAANVADTVAITGFVRRYSAVNFERDYSWFRSADYPDIKGGEWLIVATSVKTPEGTELVPPGVISDTSPAGKNP